MNIDQELLARIRKTMPELMAQEILNVQPMNVNMEKVLADPVVNNMLNNFYDRLRNKS